MNNLNEYKKNYYSQNGEDGVLREILLRLGLSEKSSPDLPLWCVEFGAWDGKHLSNTFHLVKEFFWNAVYIEGDKERFNDLQQTCKDFPFVHPVNAFVDHEKDSQHTLDKILSQTQLPRDFEILSIDIDSNDLAIWQSFSCYTPKIVLIEINSSIPPGILMWHSVGNKGNSFSSTISVGKSKGYSLVCHTGNMIFVRNDLLPQLDIDAIYFEYPELLFCPTWYFSEAEQKTCKDKNLFKRILRRIIH